MIKLKSAKINFSHFFFSHRKNQVTIVLMMPVSTENICFFIFASHGFQTISPFFTLGRSMYLSGAICLSVGICFSDPALYKSTQVYSYHKTNIIILLSKIKLFLPQYSRKIAHLAWAIITPIPTICIQCHRY